MSYIYAIECAGQIKIGFSEDPARRFNKVSSDAPFPCVLLGFWPGSKEDELALHDAFKDWRVHGEWFRSTERLLSFIAGVMLPKKVFPEPTNEVLKARSRLGLTQTEMAQKLDVNISTIVRWEKGHLQISQLAKLAVDRLVEQRKVAETQQ